MLRIKMNEDSLELFMPQDLEVKMGSGSLQIGNDITLEYDGTKSIFLRTQETLESDQVNHDSVSTSKTENSQMQTQENNESQAFSDTPTKKLSNKDYVVMAIEELGKPMQSVDEIIPILKTNGYSSKAKSWHNPVRYYLTSDDRIVRTEEGWVLQEWLERKTGWQKVMHKLSSL